MIGRLTGRVAEKQPPTLLLDVQGVGYEVQCPMTSFYQLPDVDQETTIYTHFVVREDAQLLFGFATKTERELFRQVIKANGVGPKLGLTILSGMSAAQFVQCVAQNDTSSLVNLPGVGKKTAERIVIELKDRLKNFSLVSETPATDAADFDLVSENTFVEAVDVEQDAVSALVALGYKPAQASRVVSKVKLPDMNSEDLIKAALKSMI